MDPHDLPLADFLMTRAVVPAIAERGIRLAWPILQKARLRRYERPDGARFDPETFRDAVRNATGRDVRDVRTRFLKDIFDASATELRYGGLVEFGQSLAIALYEARWPRLRDLMHAAYGGADAVDAVRDGLWERIRREVADPLGFQFWDNADAAPISSAGESLATGLHYLLAAAVCGDGKGVEEMDGLVKLLGRWIPVGEIKNEPGTWLAVASSV